MSLNPKKTNKAIRKAMSKKCKTQAHIFFACCLDDQGDKQNDDD